MSPLEAERGPSPNEQSSWSAYGYLSASVTAFRSPDEFVTMLNQTGFVDVAATRLTFGIVFLYTARKG